MSTQERTEPDSAPLDALSLSPSDWPFLLASVTVVLMTWRYGLQSFWLPADEGVYFHCAERVLQGQVPERDFLTLKGGGDIWVNALACKLFGLKFSSLRWPSVVSSLLQLPLVYLMLRPLGRWVAALGVLWIGALGLPAIPSPASSLIALLFVMGSVMIANLSKPWESPHKLTTLGLLIGLTFCSRQINAVFLGCGLLSWVLAHPDTEDRQKSGLVGRGLLLASAIFVTYYGFSRSDLFGKLAFGLPPILLAWQAFWQGRPSHLHVARILKWGGLGFGIAFLPLLAIYAYLGNLTEWLNVLFIKSAINISLNTMVKYHLSDILLDIGRAAPSIRSPLALVQLGTWLFLLTTSLGVGLFAFYRRREKSEVPVWVFCGPFMALGALHLEIAIYLIWSIPVAVLGGIYCFQKINPTSGRYPVVALLLFLGFFNSVVGKPVWLRDQRDFVLTGIGGRLPLTYLGGRADLFVPPAYADFYRRSLALIQKEVAPNETLFSFPYHPEWYALTGRTNPTPHVVPGLSIVDRASLEATKSDLQKAHTKLIIFRRNDIISSPFTQQLRDWLDQDYEIIHQEADYEFLRLKKTAG